MGAKNIKAYVTTMYCDFKKKEKFLAAKRFYEDFDIIEINHTNRGIEIVFADEEDDFFVVNGFSRIRNEDCYAFIDRLSDEIQADKKQVEVWVKLPKIIRRIVAIYSKNKRTIQYVEKSKESNGYRIINVYEL